MGRLMVVACLVAAAATPFAQTPRGSLTGTVSGPDGAAVADAPVQAKNKATGAVARTMTSADGRYMFGDLPAGTYQLSIEPGCCALKGFFRDDIAVPSGEIRIDIRLDQGVSLKTLLDDPTTVAAMIRKRAIVPSQPVRRTTDGKPDLSGVWLANEDRYPEQPSALPWAAAMAKQRIENDVKDHPHNRCLPGSAPTPAATPPFLAKLVQTRALLVILFEDAPGFRQVFLDGRSHPADPNPTWVGHSIGTWEGETLVVDTVGFNDQGWMGIFPRTEMLHIVERYGRPDFGHLEIKVTIEDPGVFTKPWNMNLMWDLLPKEEVLEYVCERKP